MTVRQARAADLDRATETITLAFIDDPVWRPRARGADGGTDHLGGVLAPVRRRSLQDQDGVWLLDDGAAVAVWIPPGGQELDDPATDGPRRVQPRDARSGRARELHELYDRFEANHPTRRAARLPEPAGDAPGPSRPRDRPDAARRDARQLGRAGLPSYLESTNPANDHRYRARRLPADRRVHGGPGRSADLDDVADGRRRSATLARRHRRRKASTGTGRASPSRRRRAGRRAGRRRSACRPARGGRSRASPGTP